jgi:hypothetical protein
MPPPQSLRSIAIQPMFSGRLGASVFILPHLLHILFGLQERI